MATQNIVLPGQIECLKGERIVSIEKVPKRRNNVSIIHTTNRKYVLKKGKERNIQREIEAIKRINSFSSVRASEVLEYGRDYFLALFEENLRPASLDELAEILYNFHEEGLAKDSAFLSHPLFTNFFVRGVANKILEEDNGMVGRILAGRDLLNIFNREEGKITTPQTLCHGDAHRKNIFYDSQRKPFFIDLEFSHLNQPSFDISTGIFSEPENLEEFLYRYLSLPVENLMKIPKDKIGEYALIDTLRICVHDLSRSLERMGGEELEKRIEHNKHVVERVTKYL